MSSLSRSGAEAAELVLEALFAHPPVSQAELEQRLGQADAAALRRALVERIRRGQILEPEGSVLVAAFASLGAQGESEALLAIAHDPALESRLRVYALTVLAGDDPAQLEALLRTRDPEETAPLTELWLTDLLSRVPSDAKPATSIALALEAVSPEARAHFLQRLELIRSRVGASAAAAYGPALRLGSLRELRGVLLAHVVREATPDGIALLERLWREAPKGEDQRELHLALVRARTRRIDPSRTSTPSGHGYVASCDGQGVFLVIGCLHNPDGTLTVAEVCALAGAEIRDGFVVARRSEQDVMALLDEIARGTGISFVRVSLEQVGALITDAAWRSRCRGTRLPAHAASAVALFDRDTPARAAGSGAGLSARQVNLEDMRALLRRPEYESSWFFDRGDLHGLQLGLPEGRAALESWVAQAALRLCRPALRDRVAAMARHMAAWHRWKNEPELADQLAAAARATEEDFATSPLVHAMLERSIVPVGEQGNFVDRTLDRAMVRQHLKSLFFHHLCAPKGRDLARLDFTEAALGCLKDALLALPGERRPAEDACATAAFSIGKAFADFLLAGARWPIERVTTAIAQVLRDLCGLSAEEIERITMVVLSALGDFLDQRCSECPVACLDRPRADVADAFFSPEHPADKEDPD